MSKSATQSGREVVRIMLPMGETPVGESYVSRHVEVNALSHEQALAMRRLFDGLQESVARLKSGKVITHPADAVRWLLEQIAAQLGTNGSTTPAA